MEKELGKPTLDIWDDLKKFTDARIALGRVGAAIPTDKHLAFQLAHASARDSVNSKLDFSSIEQELTKLGLDHIKLQSKATDKSLYLKRPDLGRELTNESKETLLSKKYNGELVIILGDGLSAKAIQRQAIPFLNEFIPMLNGINLFPIILVEGARVAIGDDIGETLGASLSIVLIGERPGLSSPDSMGLYLTYNPKIGKKDSERNCISNIRYEGLTHKLAAEKANYLLRESFVKKISGIELKDNMTEKNTVFIS